MTKTPLETVVPEEDFARLLGGVSEVFARLSSTLLASAADAWPKRYYFELFTESDELESVLDDYGARWNRTYNYLVELTASVRGLSQVGLSLEHLTQRIDGYEVLDSVGERERAAARGDLERARRFAQGALRALLEAWLGEARERGIQLATEPLASIDLRGDVRLFRLPRTLGQEELVHEEQRIAEVASKYLQACGMFQEARLGRESDPERRALVLRERCNEELARVYEATVHNLQSAYDTHVKNTVLEAGDERLPRLRGHVSTALHLLEAVTQFMHFVERHEGGARSESAERRLSRVVPPDDVRDVTLNVLLYWAQRFLEVGRPFAEALLPAYTNLQALEVELAEGIVLHARPASLIVAIVNHHGTPVEMDVAGHTCNAGSILELMVIVGSHPEARTYSFRGDERPLRDIGLLFEASLGEDGLERLPPDLGYLRG
jgi:hypothetical protein